MKLILSVLAIALLSACGGFHGRTEDIPNFARVNAHLYRGGQPTFTGFAYLKSLHVTQVVKLNDEDLAGERDSARRFGIKLVYVPISLKEQLLGGASLNEKIETVEGALENGVTFVHCLNGWDRTGLAVAIERVAWEGWRTEAAFNEMEDFGFHWQLLGLTLYYRNFGGVYASR